MTIHISRTFLSAIGSAAGKLSDHNPVVKLDPPFGMFSVLLTEPTNPEFAVYAFTEVGIDREGVFYLVTSGIF